MLKEREATSRHDLLLLGEKHKKLEAAHSEEVLGLESEITMKNQNCHNLETEVQDLRRDSALKNTEINNLKEELKALMNARNEVAESLKSSNYNLECKLEEKTRELVVLVEKHNRHSILLEAIEKEACVVRESVDETNAYIQQKEEEVFSFQKNLLKVLDFESTFLERIDYLEQELKVLSTNLNEKNELVVALEKKLEAAANDHIVEAERAIFKETLEAKDSLIFTSQQEKEVLLENLKNYETITERLQTSIMQQDQLVVKYQHEVLALQKESDACTRVLTETERSLSEVAEKNKELRDKMQEQKQDFAVQAAQLCKNAEMALEQKISMLEVKTRKIEHLLTEKMVEDKERIRNRYQGNVFSSSNDVSLPLKAASTKDAGRQEVVIETCENCSQDLSENVHDPSEDTMENPEDSKSFAEVGQESGLKMTCLQLSVSSLELEDNDIPDRLDQTRHLCGGNHNYVLNMPCNDETAKESLSKERESGLFDKDLNHPVNSQLTKRLEGGNFFHVNSILERLGRPQSKVKENCNSLQTDVVALKSSTLLRHASIKKLEEQVPDLKASVRGLDEQEQVTVHSESRSQETDPPITSVQTQTMELNERGYEQVPTHELDEHQLKKTQLDTQLLVFEIPKPLEKWTDVHKKDIQKEALSEGELHWQPMNTTQLQSRAQLSLLDIPTSPGPMKIVESESGEREAPVYEVNVQQEQQQTTSSSESPLSPKLSEQMDTRQEPPANGADDKQHKKTYSNSAIEVELQKPSPTCLDAPKNVKHETAIQQQKEDTYTSLESPESVEVHEKDIFPSAVHIQSMLPINVPPSLSNNNTGKERFPLEAAEDPPLQNNESMTKSVIELSNSGLKVQFSLSSMLRTDPKSTKKKAHVPTSASACFCNVPPYGYMVNCKICGTCFHAACVRFEEMKPGETYTCATCNEQPNRKRRQVETVNRSSVH